PQHHDAVSQREARSGADGAAPDQAHAEWTAQEELRGIGRSGHDELTGLAGPGDRGGVEGRQEIAAPEGLILEDSADDVGWHGTGRMIAQWRVRHGAAVADPKAPPFSFARSSRGCIIPSP